jgi:hypothetical protein
MVKSKVSPDSYTFAAIFSGCLLHKQVEQVPYFEKLMRVFTFQKASK